MSVSQNYGVLRIVQASSMDYKTLHPEKYSGGWAPQGRFVHLLTRRETTIGRALSNDLILMDPSVSRMHARLILDEHGWRLCNLTEQNAVHVNGHPVPSGSCVPVKPQDFLSLGGTMLQLIAPVSETPACPGDVQNIIQHYSELTTPVVVDKVSLQDDGHVSPDLSQAGEERNEASMSPTYLTISSLPTPVEEEIPEPASTWSTKENQLDGEITLQFAFSHKFKLRARWIIAGLAVLIVILGALATLAFNSVFGISTLVQDSPLNFFFIVTIPIIPAVGISLLVNFIDRFEREPWFLRLAAFVWGAIIAIPPTSFIEGYIQEHRVLFLGLQPSKVAQALFSGFSAGITEETVKGLGLLLLFLVLRDEFDNVTDGIVYGALIGAGFAMGENFITFISNPRAVLFLVTGRIVLGWLNHSTFTVCFGAALGYIRHTQVRWQQIVIPLLGYLVSIGLHAVFDFINFFASLLVLSQPNNVNIVFFSLIASVGNYIPPFIVQMIILYCLIKSLAHESAIIREFLASEVANSVVTVDEYALLQHSFLRTRIERHVLFKYGWRQWLRVKALYQTEIGLAFRKWHVNMGDKPKLGYIQPEDAYRQRIQRLRQEIAVAEKK